MVEVKLNYEYIAKLAYQIGFDLVGVSEYTLLTKEVEYLKEWLSKGYNGEMKYLERNLEKREDVREILSSANSVISLGINYYNGERYTNKDNYYKVSRYAWGTDYHYVMWEKIDKLIDMIKAENADFEAVRYVDTGPVMDKVWGVKSGLGWMGKHTNIINKNIGSWFFIGNIFSNAKFDKYSEEIKDYCGRCTKCIDNCPTEALLGNYEINASKCISYLTIENKGEIPEEFKGKFNNWLFGCDICQEVCPWNKKFFKLTKEMNFIIGENVEFNEEDFINLNNKSFKERFNKSAILRAKLKGMVRNVEFLKKF